MKIRIIGPCGSGKSTLARELSLRYDIPFYEIDNLIWDRSADQRKFPEADRDAKLRSILSSDSWIVEGVQYKDWTLGTIEKADLIFLLKPHVLKRDLWIIKRFMLSRTGIRPWNYKQSFGNLCKMMVRWNHQYEIEAVTGLIEKYRKTSFVVRNKAEVIREIEKFNESV
ncbi:hypothetical protein [Cohnella sp. JJ-181]|uniref:hypothetical protein n=1 Tax=Cohnella rhizoplanae TaxID=2974897 RepID=UPI00232B91D7|nr:hypothetical protein [Cohnella sp. JJ-181]